MSDSPLMLSVSGMRGLVGASLTPPVVSRYAAAFGSWLKSSRGTTNPHVAVGRDSRPSGAMVEAAAVAGLVSVGCRVTRLGIVSTPGVAVMLDELSADGGMVLTASHNPVVWNGVKPLRHDGVAPPPEDVRDIIGRFERDELDYADVHGLSTVADNDTTVAVHVARVLEHVDVESIRGAKLKAVVDSVHGAGGPEAAALLDALGVELFHEYAEPTGLFPHMPEPTRENLTELCTLVKKHKADIGFAQDPDADRLAVVDERGQYIGEEYTLALCVLHGLQEGGHTVANLSTSRMIDDIAARVGGTVHRTPVGEANVAKGMRDHGARLGGEGNGGIILAEVSQVRDSLVGMAMLLEMLAEHKRSLSEVVASIPAYAIVKDKAPVDPKLVAKIEPALRDAFTGQAIDTQDGVRVDWPDRWVHVRPSNTEPIVRLIAEAATEDDANALIAQTKVALGLG